MDRRGAHRDVAALAVAAWERCDARQTSFSYMSAAIPMLLVIVFVSDLIIGHAHLNRLMVSLWLCCAIIAVVVPLALGRRFPRWAGIAMFTALEAWSTYFLLFTSHVHAEINALLELPLVALYIGWFYPGILGRALLVAGVLRMLVILVLNPGIGDGLADSRVLVGYAILVALFCFEGSRTVQRYLRSEARTDALTGALNRRGLRELSDAVRRQASRRGEPVSLAMIDFDDFKALNDAGGHVAGDAALQSCVQEWGVLVERHGGSGRRGGLVARLGGDEFALLFRCDAAAAEAALRRLRAASEFAWSWGIATADPGEPLEAVLARADAALYIAKPGSGRGSHIAR